MRIARIVVCLVAIATSAAAQDIERLIIVQGSVGQAGREHAYLNFQNGEQIDVTVSVSYVRPRPAAPITRIYTIGAEDRRSIEIAADVPELSPSAYFSVVAYVTAPDELPAAVDMRITWHRAPDHREVETLTAVVRRTPKR